MQIAVGQREVAEGVEEGEQLSNGNDSFHGVLSRIVEVLKKVKVHKLQECQSNVHKYSAEERKILQARGSVVGRLLARHHKLLKVWT